ncbi:MAG: hypothetical protein Q7R57_04700 [Dehalococcoidales bacterium]|nr:hypothetical protein [Dehalococcoidales bacterium]
MIDPTANKPSQLLNGHRPHHVALCGDRDYLHSPRVVDSLVPKRFKRETENLMKAGHAMMGSAAAVFPCKGAA